jgi:uncharacterized protein (TIGR03437 family)
LIVWAIGLGATNPAIVTGAAAPLNPPAVVVNPPRVSFSGGGTFDDVAPSFSGLSGGSAGLYQIVVTVPANLPKGAGSVRLEIPEVYSAPAPLIIQ